MSFTYRPGTSKDVDALTSLFYNTIQNVNIQHYSQAEVDDWSSWASAKDRWHKEIEEQKFILAWDGNTLAGFASITVDGLIDLLFISMDYQRKGVAKELILRLIEIGHMQNNESVYTESSITAKGLFLHMGFHVEKEQRKQSKKLALENYVMRKTII